MALVVPPVVVGCWQLLEREKDPEQAFATLEAYHQAGLNTFDTADIYGPSEQILGEFQRRVLANEPEAKLEFYTKFVTGDPSPAAARRTNDRSRQALGVQSLRLVQFHWWDFADKRFVQAAGHLGTLQKEGRVEHVAVTNFDVAHLRMLLDAGVDVKANQVQFSLLDRRPENGMLAFCREKGIQLLAYGSVAGGWLSDKYLGAKEGSVNPRTASMRMYLDSLLAWGSWSLYQELLQALRQVGLRHGASVAHVAGQWTLQRIRHAGGGGGLIVGVRDTRHLEATKTLAAMPFELDGGDLAKIDAVLQKGNPPRGDCYSRERGL